MGSDLRWKMWKHIFREPVGEQHTTPVVCCIMRGHPAKAGRPKTGKEKVQHRGTIMNLVRQRNRLSCGQLAAAICEGREQGCRKAIAFFRLR